MAEKIRQYLINGSVIMAAYDINEALLQWHIKYKGSEVTEIMPVTIAEEKQSEKTEQKKEVHVKPNPVRHSDLPFVKSPDTD